MSTPLSFTSAHYETRDMEQRNTEHPRDDGTTPEQRKTEQRNAEHQWNSRKTTEKRQNTGITEHHRT